MAILALLACAAVALAPSPLAAITGMEVPPAVFLNQPPMTDADMPKLTEFAIYVDANQEMMWNRIVRGKYRSEDERRLFYLIIKYVTAVYMIQPDLMIPAEDAVNFFGPQSLPSPEELEVTRRHYPAVEQAREEARLENSPGARRHRRTPTPWEDRQPPETDL
jgi:hypothetical protein